MKVTVYLKTPLFAAGHVPSNTWVLEGELQSSDLAGYLVVVSAYKNDDGKELDGQPAKLLLPGGKVDHIVLQD